MIQKKISIFIILLTVFFSGNAQGIEFFHGTWKEAMAKAKAEDKPLFVDAFAKWCGPCKSMAKNVFTQDEVGKFYNTNFINLKLDMEETDGVTFGHSYPVQAYPTLFFLDGDGKVLKLVKGGQTPEGLVSLGNEALKKIDRSLRYEDQYRAGDRSFDLMYNYVKALNAAGKPSLKISNDFFSYYPQLTDIQRLKFILEAAVDADSKLFDQVIENKSKIEKEVGKAYYIEKCKSALAASSKKAVDYEMESMLNDAKIKAEKTLPDDEAEIFIAGAEMQFFKAFKNEEKYMTAYRKLAKNVDDDPVKLKEIVTDIIRSYKDHPKMILDAADYASQIYELKDDMESLTQYCSILVLGKQAEKAIKVVNKAREKAEKSGAELSPYDNLLSFLNSKKS